MLAQRDSEKHYKGKVSQIPTLVEESARNKNVKLNTKKEIDFYFWFIFIYGKQLINDLIKF